ncbi:MAG: DUF3619 family protein [Proteobacteria bacterium]|nr:DUF3619 family protein [Pseudomonadota bacterium]
MKNQKLDHQQIAKLLTQGSEQLDAQILSSLREARILALHKQRVAEPVFSLSAIGHRAHMPHTPQQWVATTILLAAIAVGAFGYWQNSQVPVDIDILTDELPIEVFVDQHE